MMVTVCFYQKEIRDVEERIAWYVTRSNKLGVLQEV